MKISSTAFLLFAGLSATTSEGLVVPDATISMPATPTTVMIATTHSVAHPQQQLSKFSFSTINSSSEALRSWIQENLGVPPVLAAESTPPTKDEIALLRSAFSAFYGTDRDVTKAEELLTKTITAWQRQPADEQAGLYRVRGDIFATEGKAIEAISDYTTSISLITETTAGRNNADPAELPAAYLGRARAIRGMHASATPEQAAMGAKDYEEALKLSSREEWDSPQELLEDGARTNPYAAWEYGMALRLVGDLSKAQEIHILAADIFDDIGDKARSVISILDAGIDAAASNKEGNADEAKRLLKEGIAKTKTVEGRDIPLLQRVIAKEGEARIALASLSWTTGDRPEAEKQLGLACQRLDQLEADAIQRNKVNPAGNPLPKNDDDSSSKLSFNIDDSTVGAFDISCTRLRNKDYLTKRLEWPSSLQQKVGKLYALSK